MTVAGGRTPEGVATHIRFAIGLAGLFVATVAIALGVLALAFGLVPTWDTTVIGSGSMTPALRVGDVIVYRPVAADQVGEGTVVVFEDDVASARGLVVHRVATVAAPGVLVTKGDANASNDSLSVGEERLRGTAFVVIPWIGMPRLWAAEGQWLPLFALGAGLIFAGVSCRYATNTEFDPWRGRARLAPAVSWMRRPPPQAPPWLVSPGSWQHVLARARESR